MKDGSNEFGKKNEKEDTKGVELVEKFGKPKELKTTRNPLKEPKDF